MKQKDFWKTVFERGDGFISRAFSTEELVEIVESEEYENYSEDTKTAIWFSLDNSITKG